MAVSAVVTASEVEDAVNEFYKNPNGKGQVHSWLTQAQHSTHAWNFAFQLLDSSKSREVQFFGGNTIYIKISRHWHEVPEEEYEGLKRKLLELTVQFCDNKAIAGRLLKAIAAFVLNTLSKSWPTALEDLVATFNPDTVTGIAPSVAMDILFTILMIIPDELEDCHETMGITKHQRNTIKSLLIENSKGVLVLMQQVMQADQVSNVTKEIVVKALDSWMKLPLCLSQTKDLLLALIPFCNYGLLCECIIDCFRTALASEECIKNPSTVMDFIMRLLQLTPVLEEALLSEDENTASLIYSLYSLIVENHSRLLLNVALEDRGEKRAAFLQLVTLLVQCSGTAGQYPTHEMLSSIPFSVWYSLQDDLITFFKGAERDQLMQLLKPIYLQLVDFFLAKSLHPPDEALNSEEKELFRCYRQDVCDSYMHTYIILRSSMLDQMEIHLQNNVTRLQRDPNDWRPLESLLHAYASVAETVLDTDANYILRFIQFIPQIPFRDNVLLITVALSTLGAYAEWLNFHQDHLQYVIPLMVAGVVNERLVGAASQALRDLTLECPDTISPFSLHILDACQKALVQFGDCDAAVKERLVTIIARVLSVGASHEVVIEHLNLTLTPIIGSINSIKDSVMSQGSFTKEQHIALIRQLRLLSCLARSLNGNCGYGDVSTTRDFNGSTASTNSGQSKTEEQPLLMVLRPLLSILDGLVDMTADKHDVIEVLCKLIKNSVSTLMLHIEPLLPGLMSIIPRMYNNTLSPAVLDVVRPILILFGGVSSVHLPQMKALTDGILSYTLQRVKSELWTYTHVVQAILSFTTSVSKKLPHLLSPEQIHTVFIFAIEALKLPEEGSMKASSGFLLHFLNISKDKGEMYKQIVLTNQDHFVRTLMTCICNSPRHGLSSINDLLYVMCKFFGGHGLMNVFKQIENDSNFLTTRVSQQDKQKFSKALLRASNVRESITAVTDLALTSRGVAGTEYGATTSNTLHYF